MTSTSAESHVASHDFSLKLLAAYQEIGKGFPEGSPMRVAMEKVSSISVNNGIAHLGKKPGTGEAAAYVRLSQSGIEELAEVEDNLEALKKWILSNLPIGKGNPLKEIHSQHWYFADRAELLKKVDLLSYFKNIAIKSTQSKESTYLVKDITFTEVVAVSRVRVDFDFVENESSSSMESSKIIQLDSLNDIIQAAATTVLASSFPGWEKAFRSQDLSSLYDLVAWMRQKLTSKEAGATSSDKSSVVAGAGVFKPEEKKS